MVGRVPIRWRLTIWYAALLAITVAVFGTILYVGLRHSLYDSFDEELHGRATVIAAAVRHDGTQLSLDPAATGPSDDEHFVRLFAADGDIILDTSSDLGDVPLERRDVSRAQAGETVYRTIDLHGDALRIVSLPIRSESAVAGVLELGIYRDDADESLAALLTLLGIITPVALVAAIGGGYLLAGRALAPVASISNLAASISGTGDDLHARLNLALPDDELGRLARTFDGMLERIERAFERQRQFTADAAHELRTPLSLMRSEIDLALARPRTADEYRGALTDLDADLQRLTSLIGTLLMLARADRGQLSLTRTRFDLADTVAVVVEQYTEAAMEAGIQLQTDTVPSPLDGDDDLLVQVLVNLLDNALAHTPSGGTITLGCAPDDGRVGLWVADTGSGIAAEHLPHVFERFYRADSARARARGGAGLGLNICRSIVEAHGGTIALISEPGRGTRVAIVLPIAD